MESYICNACLHVFDGSLDSVCPACGSDDTAPEEERESYEDEIDDSENESEDAILVEEDEDSYE